MPFAEHDHRIGPRRQNGECAARQALVMGHEARELTPGHTLRGRTLAFLIGAPSRRLRKARRLEKDEGIQSPGQIGVGAGKRLVDPTTPNAIWIFVPLEVVERRGKLALRRGRDAHAPSLDDHDVAASGDVPAPGQPVITALVEERHLARRSAAEGVDVGEQRLDVVAAGNAPGLEELMAFRGQPLPFGTRQVVVVEGQRRRLASACRQCLLEEPRQGRLAGALRTREPHHTNCRWTALGQQFSERPVLGELAREARRAPPPLAPAHRYHRLIARRTQEDSYPCLDHVKATDDHCRRRLNREHTVSTTTLTLTPALRGYIHEAGVRELPILAELREATARLPVAGMQISPEQSALLANLVRILRARRVIEIGTFTGYSALWMALAQPPGGELIACDIDREWTHMARRFWQRAGVATRIRLRIAPALETLDALLAADGAERFDLVFIDADKRAYPDYYERLHCASARTLSSRYS